MSRNGRCGHYRRCRREPIQWLREAPRERLSCTGGRVGRSPSRGCSRSAPEIVLTPQNSERDLPHRTRRVGGGDGNLCPLPSGADFARRIATVWSLSCCHIFSLAWLRRRFLLLGREHLEQRLPEKRAFAQRRNWPRFRFVHGTRESALAYCRRAW